MRFYKIGEILPEISRNYNLDLVMEVFELLKTSLPEKVFYLIDKIGVEEEELVIYAKKGSVKRSELRLYKEEILKLIQEVFKDRYNFQDVQIK